MGFEGVELTNTSKPNVYISPRRGNLRVCLERQLCRALDPTIGQPFEGLVLYSASRQNTSITAIKPNIHECPLVGTRQFPAQLLHLFVSMALN